jgi:hypothetical protein
MFAVLLHVGQTPNISPHGKCPIYSNGTFKFVQAFFSPPRSEPDPTYEQLGLAEFVKREYRNCPAFRSPEFQTLTYSHITRGGESNIYEKLRDEGGFLVFFSTLYYCDKIPPAVEGVSRNRGAYIIGYFDVEGIYNDMEVVKNPKLQDRFKNNGQFGRTTKTGDRKGADWWISGSAGQQFPKAIPLTEISDHLMWNSFSRNNLTTTTGKPLSNYTKAYYNWTLVCPPQNLESLRSWILTFTGAKI